MIIKEDKERLRSIYLLEKRKESFDEYYRDEIVRLNNDRFLSLSLINESEDEDTNKVLELINNNSFDINNYDEFINSMINSKYKGFLTQYLPEELKNRNIKTFKVKDYDMGYAITPEKDIISLHNNSGVGGIGKALLQSAIKNGGESLDHFDGYLSQLYQEMGFKEYNRTKFDDKYKPTNWDEEKHGKPDVIYRRLAKK